MTGMSNIQERREDGNSRGIRARLNSTSASADQTLGVANNSYNRGRVGFSTACGYRGCWKMFRWGWWQDWMLSRRSRWRWNRWCVSTVMRLHHGQRRNGGAGRRCCGWSWLARARCGYSCVSLLIFQVEISSLTFRSTWNNCHNGGAVLGLFLWMSGWVLAWAVCDCRSSVRIWSFSAPFKKLLTFRATTGDGYIQRGVSSVCNCCARESRDDSIWSAHPELYFQSPGTLMVEV